MSAGDLLSVRRARTLSTLLALALLGCPGGPVPAEGRERAASSETPAVAPEPTPPSAPPPSAPPAPAQPARAPAPPLAGITWDTPTGFTPLPPSSAMRAAEYGAPDGQARLVVFFFPEMRETVRANIERWKSQFDESARESARVETRGVAGLSVTTLDIEGANAGMHGAPGGAPAAEGPRERMLGAAVVAPDGVVFFKFVGPSASVAAGQAGFDAMIASLRPVPAAPQGGE